MQQIYGMEMDGNKGWLSIGWTGWKWIATKGGSASDGQDGNGWQQRVAQHWMACQDGNGLLQRVAQHWMACQDGNGLQFENVGDLFHVLLLGIGDQ